MEQQDSLSKDIIVFEVVESTEVGTDDQDCTRQITELTEFAERAGYTVTGIYQEKASGARNDRPERAKVIDLAKKRKIDAVLVHELSRWTRSTVDNITTLQALASWNVSLITMNGVDFDLTTPHGKAMNTVLAAFNEMDRDVIRQRINSGIAAAKAKGVKFGRPETDHKDTAEIIAMINAGMSYRNIAAELGISKTTVTNMAKRHRSEIETAS